jgi:manganese oxidase
MNARPIARLGGTWRIWVGILVIASPLVWNLGHAASITADVVALDQVYFYNRFGSYNPVGMMYALRRDVVDSVSGQPIGAGGIAGQVALRSDKRPRPLVLRANVGDTLTVRFTNLLDPLRPVGPPEPPGPPEPGPPHPGIGGDAPATRSASMVTVGLTTTGNNGISGVPPGSTATYSWSCEREGTHVVFSNAAPAGGEGDGGSTVQGLFGAIHCEPTGSRWYRSQVSAEDLAAATVGTLPTGHPRLNYETLDANGVPVLNMRKGTEIVHSDLNGLIVGVTEPSDGVESTPEGNFREFTVMYHDEIKAVQAFPLLNNPQLAGVRDGFAINYGSSGMGALLLANRQGIGPAKDCVGCAYEEFFLTSWANGDPALLVDYADDPSNVHHSYLNDHVKFRVLHGGVKETHVHHLHAHQWLGAFKNETNSTYLDSQSIGPFQAYTTEIQYGGSGNRNRTVGDSIFHCHLYPHFAQGMWELWRTHDTFEDGTRRLPDGEHGAGTDPLTGTTVGGTPIPAVVPMPLQAMLALPTYGDTNGDGVVDGFPGYPFYIAGKTGHRPPQPPFEPVVSGGLPRHILTGGSRVTNELLGTAADFSVHHNSLNIQLVEPEGTPLERVAMAFHAKASGHATVTPEGASAAMSVNGLPPVPGAPYADPCPPGMVTGTRNYHVSAIQLDLLVNDQGWHDPQARINVLDSDVANFEGKSTTAVPFFFRANSGECINFYHTNRTPRELERDDFQVRTPTDIIGQHIHLVKFDVTSSDGSGNGWNYEDGTLARDEISERIAASKAPGGSVLNPDGTPTTLNATGAFQTTVQRWFADPLLNQLGQDRTIRTVFTHDHFSPSSIQHHGFYSALLIEPAGSRWLSASGLDDLSQPMSPARGVGTQMMIVDSLDQGTHADHREFAMAVADFAIVYDPSVTPKPGTIRPEFGNPVNAPALPEAISVDDPGTTLVNYKNAPIPLRIANFNDDGSFAGMKPGKLGDMAYVFDSTVHGDPFTETFKGYEGDRVVLRTIQGAQEEQHVFAVQGMRWKREQNSSSSVLVGAQPTGISEHFEFDLGLLDEVGTGFQTSDYLYHFTSSDDRWNGAWGFIRSFAGPNSIDPDTGRPVGEALSTLPNNADGRFTRFPPDQVRFRRGCPSTAPLKKFTIEAWAAQDLLPAGAIVYNARVNITDPSGLMFIYAGDRTAYQSGTKRPEPLVIRVNAGDCVQVNLTNRLPQAVPDHIGDAIMPPITGLEVDMFRPSNRVSLSTQVVDYDVRTDDGINAGWNGLKPDGSSSDRTVGPGGSVAYQWYAGTVTSQKNRLGQDAKIGTPIEMGSINLISGGDVIKQTTQGLVGALIVEPLNTEFRDLNTGALLPLDRNNMSARIAPRSTAAGSRVPPRSRPARPVRPVRPGTQPTAAAPVGFVEHVLVYQGGLNLLQGGVNMPDSFIADDAEDAGGKAINYRTEPFSVRLGLPGGVDTNDQVYPPDFFLGPIETPVLKAKKGEEVRFRVLFPAGPGRQNSFLVYGHDYPDLGIPDFLSSGVSLMAPGLAITAKPYGGAKTGTWIYRPGPTFMFSSGMWGRFEVQ